MWKKKKKKKRCSDAQNVQGNNFDPLVKQLIKELTKAAPENRGYAEGRATSSSLYAYGIANCWRTMDQKLCTKCVDKASEEILLFLLVVCCTILNLLTSLVHPRIELFEEKTHPLLRP
ncbi:unnamed protein product [Fraxinus pennsylvanica]|uniref:Gnk2-homologous domain-containing protein n=1 Tax=Fraxinus pennsylvanica TaxID=56036 RepID=A0AAD1YKT1_9LAMI|nr:unnamed protein product [Fraxinus pennsylvanica]